MKFWAAWWLRLVADNQRRSLATACEAGKEAATGFCIFLLGIAWLIAVSWWYLPVYWLVRRHRDRGDFRVALAKIRSDKLRSDWNIRDRLDVFPRDRRYQILMRAIEHRRRMRKRAALAALNEGGVDGSVLAE